MYNETITISSTTSSPKSGLANPSIDLALNDESAVLLDVNDVHLDVASLDIHDGKSLLPISRSLGVLGLSKVHEITYLNSV